jgi:hypothetical protein
MNTYEALVEEMEARLAEELSQISEEQNTREVAGQSLVIFRRYLVQLKTHVQVNGFVAEPEEILFFKKLKPRLYSRLIYFQKVWQIELKRPAGGKKAEIKYLQKELSRITHFFRKFLFVYQYCRSDATYLDSRFFTRGNSELLPGIESYGVDTDPSFTTGYDFIVAKMTANDLLKPYLQEELAKIKKASPALPESIPGSRLSWTASKASLIELLYALQCTGVFNHGQAALSDVAVFMENVFQVKLGNYYRVFQEIRIRKKSRTQFLDELRDRLIQKMDYADENPQFK